MASGGPRPILGDGANTEIEAGVNERGEPFCTVRNHGTSTTGTPMVLVGQLDVETVRTMAMGWLAVAEAAEQDAATLRVVRKLDLPDQVAALVITELRAGRKPQT